MERWISKVLIRHFEVWIRWVILNYYYPQQVSVDSNFSDLERWIIRSYRLIKKFSLSAVEDFGLETANVQEG
ncbi:MAG: hypothetical protein IPP42_02100 [Saprospiraceae bacterium]|nr:hypothetical protein [Saprospiraceae bacterium]